MVTVIKRFPNGVKTSVNCLTLTDAYNVVKVHETWVRWLKWPITKVAYTHLEFHG